MSLQHSSDRSTSRALRLYFPPKLQTQPKGALLQILCTFTTLKLKPSSLPKGQKKNRNMAGWHSQVAMAPTRLGWRPFLHSSPREQNLVLKRPLSPYCRIGPSTPSFINATLYCPQGSEEGPMPVSPTSTKFRAENPQKTARPPWDQDQRQVDPARLFPQSNLRSTQISLVPRLVGAFFCKFL